MTGKDRQVRFKVGDRILSNDSNERGTIVKLCADNDAVYVRWDGNEQQEMVEVSTLRKEQAGGVNKEVK